MGLLVVVLFGMLVSMTGGDRIASAEEASSAQVNVFLKANEITPMKIECYHPRFRDYGQCCAAYKSAQNVIQWSSIRCKDGGACEPSPFRCY